MDERIREIGRRIQADEARYLDYREIEARSRELGFPTSERTLRFYVTEGVLPPPPRRRGGKTPVYEEDWILRVLLAIHVMKTRQGKSLAEIRAAIREGDFGLTPGEDPLQSELFEPEKGGGDSRETAPPGAGEPAAGPAAPASDAAAVPAPVPAPAAPPPDAPASDAPAAAATRPREKSAADPKTSRAARVTPLSLPEGAVLIEKAKALEELYIGRFDEAVADIQRVPHPTEQQLYAAGVRDRIHLRRTRADEVIDTMKRSRVYERELLEAMPLDEVSEYRVFTRSLFGKKEVRLVLAAASTSPLEDFVTRKCSLHRSGPRDLERALGAIAPRDDAFYYIGVLSTVGWARGVERHFPARPNVLVALVENVGGTEWAIRRHEDERWGGLFRLFDPETEREKIERVRRALESHPELALRGGHVIVKNLREDLNVSEAVMGSAVREVLAKDADLSLLEVGGKEILKRRRL